MPKPLLTNNPSPPFTYIDLFAGAGGLSCGLEQAGFQPLFALDNHPIHCKTYEYNHPNTYVCCKNIRELSEEEVASCANVKPGELDLLAGGPPCQGFSINAPLRTMEDQRNHLFLDFIRVARHLQPKVILIENVPGILSMEKGSVVKAIYQELEIKLKYVVQHKILFAGHYGIPQLRNRTIFIGVREDLVAQGITINFPEPTHYASSHPNFVDVRNTAMKLLPTLVENCFSVWDAISDLAPITAGQMAEATPYATQPQNSYQAALRQGVNLVQNHHSSKLSEINLERLKHIPQGGSWRDIPYELLPAGMKRARRSDHTKRYGRLAPDSLCSTILTKCDPHWGSFIHPFQDRVLSVREAARIQSFPDSYVFLGKMSNQYEQVGNAVPPLLARALGLQISQALQKSENARYAAD